MTVTSSSKVLNIDVVSVITIIALYFRAELLLLLYRTPAHGISVIDEVRGLH